MNSTLIDPTRVACSYPNCNKSFDNLTKKRRHESMYHTTKGGRTCLGCGKELSSTYTRNKHHNICKQYEQYLLDLMPQTHNDSVQQQASVTVLNSATIQQLQQACSNSSPTQATTQPQNVTYVINNIQVIRHSVQNNNSNNTHNININLPPLNISDFIQSIKDIVKDAVSKNSSLTSEIVGRQLYDQFTDCFRVQDQARNIIHWKDEEKKCDVYDYKGSHLDSKLFGNLDEVIQLISDWLKTSEPQRSDWSVDFRYKQMQNFYFMVLTNYKDNKTTKIQPSLASSIASNVSSCKFIRYHDNVWNYLKEELGIVLSESPHVIMFDPLENVGKLLFTVLVQYSNLHACVKPNFDLQNQTVTISDDNHKETCLTKPEFIQLLRESWSVKQEIFTSQVNLITHMNMNHLQLNQVYDWVTGKLTDSSVEDVLFESMCVAGSTAVL